MSITNYKRPKLQNPYSPLYSTFSIYRSRNQRPSLFSPRRTMSGSGLPNNNNRYRENSISRTVSHGLMSSSSSSSSIACLHRNNISSDHSVISINTNDDDSDDLQIMSENKGVLLNLKTNFLDSSKRVMRRLMGSEDDQKTIGNKRKSQYGYFENIQNKRIKANDNNSKELSFLNSKNNTDNNQKLEISGDPFGWNKWETSEIGQDITPTKKQYGTHFIRREKMARGNHNDAAMILRGRSDEVTYLRQIFNGKYEIPKIISDERDQQLRLLERDRQVAKQQDTGIKKSIVDLTERIKKVLLEYRKNNDFDKQVENDDDIVFIKEHKLTSLEKKRQDFFNESFKLDKTLLDFEKEFKNYRQLIEERKKIQSEIKKKREDSKKITRLIPQLSEQELNEVKSTLKRGDNSIIMNKDNLEIRIRDFKTLTPKRWLNDTIIEYFMKQIESNTKNTVAFNSFFYSNLSERGYQGVRRWMKRKKVQIENLDKIFVPINLNQSHWALGLIDIENSRILYVDSLSHGPNAMSFAILNDLKKYVIEESKNTIGQDFELVHTSCPQQPNGFDCGIYVCMNTLYLSKDQELTFGFKDAIRMRSYIAHLILADGK